MYNTCPAAGAAWSTESPQRAHWGLGPGGHLGGVELGRVDSTLLSPPGVSLPTGGPAENAREGLWLFNSEGAVIRASRSGPVLWALCSASARKGSGHARMGAG